MAEPSLRNRPIQQLSSAVTAVAVIVGAVLICLSIVLLAGSGLETRVVATLGVGLVLIATSLLSYALMQLGLKIEANISRIHNNVLDSLDVIRRLEPLIKMISDNSQISDAARSIAHREKERDALVQAIREEMFGGDLEAALYLVDEMERRFGYKQQAKQLRSELTQVREMTIEEKIGEAIAHIENLMKDHRWERARQESERLMKLFPRHERILGLPAELNQRREARKQELLALWKQAVVRDEIDRGIVILTELDPYLTREEAQSLQDSARHVFKSRLLYLGVQFGLAASETRWRDALEVGLLLRQEFPNSRMAQEVAEKIDTLRIRAGFTADTEVIQQRSTTPG